MSISNKQELITFLKRLLSLKENQQRREIINIQKLILEGDILLQDVDNEELALFLYDLDYYEPDENLRKEFSFFGNKELEKRIKEYLCELENSRLIT